jgi:phosphate transport system protein
MERHFEEVEQELTRRLLTMGGMVEEMIRLGASAFSHGRGDSLAEVYRRETEVNRIHLEIDERVLVLIARYQPAASDLRFAMAASRMNADLERIGDQAVNVAQNVDAILSLDRVNRVILEVPKMADLAASMVKDALDSFARRDVDLARVVIARDDEEDRLKRGTLFELVKLMQADPASVPGGVALLLLSRNFEKIGDHATNIAEEVIFMVQGSDIRHPNLPALTDVADEWG